MVRRAFLFLAGTLALAGCAYQYGGPPTPSFPGARPLGPGGAPLSTAVPAGHGVAILAPLTGPNATLGQALVQAAKLALADGGPPLDVRDTGGTPAGAAAAASAAIAAGAGLLIGPLTASETAGAAGPARGAGVPVLAFTNDSTQAQPGVWTLGITPLQQVRRLVGAMAAQGKTRIGAVLPDSEFGHAMASALGRAATDAGLPTPDIRTHAPGTAAINSTVRDISGYANRRGPLDAQIRTARARHDAEGRRQAAELVRQPIPPAPIDALLLADTGDTLAALASLLPYYDLDSPQVRVLGPSLWAAPAARGGAALSGAYYAAPDPSLRSDFDAKYSAADGTPAPGVADLAYDAASIAKLLAPEGFSMAALCRPDGFTGADGVLALQPDGSVRRGLALFEIQRGGPTMIEPAPEQLTSPGI